MTESPWNPLSVQAGFKPGESAISLFDGLGIQPGQGAAGGGISVKPRYDEQFRSVLGSFTGMFGAMIVCDPLIAKALKAQGYDTKEQLIDYLYKKTVSVAEYRMPVCVICRGHKRESSLSPHGSSSRTMP
jgi:hypothetical protein